MTIPPDTKNWTWVVERACPECGFDASTLDARRVPDLLRAASAAWADVLHRADVRTRPRPDVWSPLEYACHVRDVCRVYDERLRLILDEDDPLFLNWDQDATAVEDRYAEQDPGAVAVELADWAERLAARFDTVDGDAWTRTGRRSDGAAFTVDTFARYFIHDVVHHLSDVGADQAGVPTR